MASPAIHPEVPKETWRGVDYRQSDLLRDVDSFVQADNIFVKRNGVLTRRPGQKVACDLSENIGLGEYIYIPPGGGTPVTKILVCGQSLYSMEDGAISITYTGAGASVLFDHYCPVDQWVFSIEVDGVVVYTKNLGTGIDEASPVSIATLISEIDALTDFACTGTGTTSGPAAYLPTLLGEVYGSTAIQIPFSYPRIVNQPSGASNPFASAWSNRNASDFNFITSVSANNVTYLGSRYDNEVKYDGQKVYRSGIPQPATPVGAVVATVTGRTGTNINYRISFKQVDARDNYIEGIISNPTANLSPAADQVSVTYTSLTAASGFNTDCAMVVGAQVAVTTINVDNGVGGAHTLKVGDVAYFFDAVANTHVARTVTASTASTIQISGAGVTVADNAPISANLRVCVYTQTALNGSYFLVAEYPHNSLLASPVVFDLGNALGAQYLFPLPGTEPGLPPMAQYRAIYKSIKILSGVSTSIDRVAYSDILNLEAYPPTANQFTIKTNQQGKHTGLLATTDYLFIGKDNSCHALVGDLDETGFFRYRVSDLSSTIGPTCQNMRQVGDASIVFISRRGVFRALAQGEPQEVSLAISPIFTNRKNEKGISWDRVTSGYDRQNWRYFFYLPWEDSDGSNNYCDDSLSYTFHLDLSGISRDEPLRFLPILGLNFGGGFVESDNQLYWASRRRSDVTSTLDVELSHFANTGTEWDQVDQKLGAPYIQWELANGWEDNGDSSVFKFLQRLKIFSLDPDSISDFEVTAGVRVNFVDSPIMENIFIFGTDSSGIGYDSQGYDTGPYDTGVEPEIDQKIKKQKAKSYQLSLSNIQRNKIPIISGWTWELTTPFKPEMKE